ncbi:MAG: hypothetical protein L0H70_09900, partial [Xanthomonadales bacterium]|nr:hypothetical protein [Xanthomonadales bacterium]
MKPYRPANHVADAISTLPRVPSLADFIHVEEIADLPASVLELFLRQCRLAVPAFPHHFVATVQLRDGESRPG